eukprot:COSAG02_NODE_7304_length_3074_cov_1.429244_2_plen_75_part_00
MAVAAAIDSDGHPVATSEIAALWLFSSLLPNDGPATGSSASADRKAKHGTVIESVWEATDHANNFRRVPLISAS